MLPVECRGVSGSGCPGRVRCVWAAPGPTSPGSSGWLDNKAPPPDCWARQLEPGSACRDTLSCPWEGGGEGAGPRETPGTARGALGRGRGSDRDVRPTSPCPNFTRRCWHGDSGMALRGALGGGEQTGPGDTAATPGPLNLPPPRGCLGWGRGTSAPGDAWGGRAGQRSADGARRRAVLCGGDSPAVGARGWGPLCSWRGGHGGGEGAAAGAAIPAMPGISPARPHVPPPGCSAAGMRCRSPDMGAATPPIPPGCVRGPRGLPLLPPVLPLPRSSAGPLSLSLPYFSCRDGGGGGIKREWGGMRRAIRSPGAVGPLPLPPSPRCC